MLLWDRTDESKAELLLKLENKFIGFIESGFCLQKIYGVYILSKGFPINDGFYLLE